MIHEFPVGGRLYGTEEEVQQYRTLATLMDREPEVVWYPASSSHTSIAHAFHRSRVIHVDPDEDAHARMVEAGYEFHCASVPQGLVTEGGRPLYVPDVSVDLLVALRASTSDFELSFIRSGGYVLCDNVYRAAYDVASNARFHLLGVLKDGKLETANIDQYIREVETEEEFAIRRPRAYGEAVEALSNVENLCPQLILHEQASFTERYRGLLQMGNRIGEKKILRRTLLSYLPMKEDADLHLFRKHETPVLIEPAASPM